MSKRYIEIIERVLCIFGVPFVACLLMHIMMGSQHFLHLARGWPFLTIFSFAALMWHCTRELQGVFEDYIPNECVRKYLVALGYLGFVVSMMVIVWQVASL